ncbi:MAG: ZPR1 zinc finger domain-containing protein [Candidatus Woesearchaeota archaeon]
MSSDVEVLEGERCPICMKETLTLREQSMDIPYFGLTHIFSMDCSNCGYRVADVESDEQRKPVKQSFTIESEADLSVRVIKSSSATIKIPRMVSIEGGQTDSEGYITNIEGLLNRFKAVLEELKQDDDKAVAKKAKNHLKRLQKVLWGQESLTITLEDKTGNSMIVTDKE